MIKLNNVQFNYLNTPPLHFNLTLEKGSKTALIGASGSGKSTLLNLIAGFIQPTVGDILLKGENHTKTAPHQRPVSMLFQENNLFTHLTVWQNMALGVAPNLKLSAEQQDRLTDIAKQVGLENHLPKRPEQLSGGQRQRVALARCLLRNQPILLLDEPFSALDYDLRQEMLELLAQIIDEKSLTLLLVTHQPEEVEQLIDQTLVLKNHQLKINKH